MCEDRMQQQDLAEHHPNACGGSGVRNRQRKDFRDELRASK